jgi:hypothetical protein
VINVAGTQGDYNNYVLDGGSHTDTFTNTNLPFPFPDALREFSVESNSLQARNGLHPGTLVNGVTVSGTNQWHGTAFDFIRNNIINALLLLGEKDTLKRNQFGGTLGGKIRRDKCSSSPASRAPAIARSTMQPATASQPPSNGPVTSVIWAATAQSITQTSQTPSVERTSPPRVC